MKKILILLLFSTNFVHATNYYVSQGAAGTNSGTLANPWNSVASINQAVMGSGDSLLFERGKKYTSGQITITKSNVVWGAYGTGEKPLFWGNGSTRAYLFYLNNLTNTIIRDIQIVDTTISATDRSILAKLQRAVTFDGTSTGCKVSNVYFDRVGVAVYFVGGTNIADSNYITNGRMVVNTPGGFEDYGANAFVIETGGQTFTHNQVISCWAPSFDFNYDGGNDFYCPSGSCGGNFIAYNTFFDSNGCFEFTGDSPGNIFIYNKYVQCESNMYFQSAATYDYSNNVSANNVFVELTLGRLNEPRLIGSSGNLAAGSLFMYNNVFYLASGVDVSNNGTGKVHENNVYKLSNGSITGYTLSTGEVATSANFWTNTSGDPLTWNYNPVAGSVLINTGKPIGQLRDYSGKAIVNNPEIGILEFENIVVTPPPTPVRTFIIKGGAPFILKPGN